MPSIQTAVTVRFQPSSSLRLIDDWKKIAADSRQVECFTLNYALAKL